jgi:hypothetical protein
MSTEILVRAKMRAFTEEMQILFRKHADILAKWRLDCDPARRICRAAARVRIE